MFGRPIDSLYPVKAGYGDNGARFKSSIDPDNGIWIPVQIRGLGQHRGVDFDCPSGTIVRAVADGLVVRARFESALDVKDGAGLYITQLVSMDNAKWWSVRYTHLKAIYVGVGQMVTRHQPIAESGDSGETDVPLLHVELINDRLQPHPIEFD